MTPQEKKIVEALIAQQVPPQAMMPQQGPVAHRPPPANPRPALPAFGPRIRGPQIPEGIFGGAGDPQVKGQAAGDTLGGSAFGETITPSGVGETSLIHNGAYAYSSVLNEFDAYSDMMKEDIPLRPGAKLDAVKATRRNIQMQLKELYNLGVLNGPDLELMDQIMFDPTSIGARAMDFVGVADNEDRAMANIDQVKRMLKNLIEPKLQAAGVDIESIRPKQEMSDEDFLKSLGIE